MLLHIHHLLEIFVIVNVLDYRFFSRQSFLPILSVSLHLYHNHLAMISILVVARGSYESLPFLFLLLNDGLINYRIPHLFLVLSLWYEVGFFLFLYGLSLF